MYLLYSLGLGLALLLTGPYWLVQMLRHGKYRAGLRERLGGVPARLRARPGAIWVHAVSVGEVLAVSGLVEQMRRRWPERDVVVSTTTATGQALARQRFGEEKAFYFPLDFGFAIRPYLQRLRPELVVLAETEFWPNFLRHARASAARVAVVNARISDRSLPRYRALRGVLRRILGNVDLFVAQSDEDHRRLLEIGAPADRVHAGGNLKFDISATAAVPLVESLRAALVAAGAGPVLVCGSTVEGEEELLLHAFARVLERHARALMVLAPRHPERFAEAERLLGSSRVQFWHRSRWSGQDAPAGGVFLLDSIGELGAVYALADLAFVGGSLVPRGGHNILEPAQHGAAILVGPHTENFRDIIATFRRADAVRVTSSSSLEADLLTLLEDHAARRELGARAAQVFRANSGATERTLALLEALVREPQEAAR